MEQPNGIRPEFHGAFHIAEAYEHMQRTYCGVMMEDNASKHPHFKAVFRRPIDALRELDLGMRLDHLPPNYLVWKCNQMNLVWAQQYRSEANEFLPEDAFLELCINALTIPVKDWILEGKCMQQVPRQILTPGKRANPEDVPGHTKKARGGTSKQTPPPNGRSKPTKGTSPPQSSVPSGAPAHGRTEICLKHLFYTADPTEYEDCKVGAKTCPRIHNVKLSSAGKLNTKDKDDVRAKLQTMPGKFGVKALAALDTLF